MGRGALGNANQTFRTQIYIAEQTIHLVSWAYAALDLRMASAHVIYPPFLILYLLRFEPGHNQDSPRHFSQTRRGDLKIPHRRQKAFSRRFPRVFGFQKRQFVRVPNDFIAPRFFHGVERFFFEKLKVKRRHIINQPAENRAIRRQIVSHDRHVARERLGDDVQARALYAELGLGLRQHFVGWDAAILTASANILVLSWLAGFAVSAIGISTAPKTVA